MITQDVRYIGANDMDIDLFEGQYPAPCGMAYNSYLILDDKIAVMDTVDRRRQTEFLENLERELGGRSPDYLVVSHVEPDHASSIGAFMETYPKVQLVGNAKTFQMLPLYFEGLDLGRAITVKEGDSLSLGRHTLTFAMAPMVHWPEVMVTYDSHDKILFSADAFGKFGALSSSEEWEGEARRYYFNIVGKYGPQAQALLKKAAGLEIQAICPLHGPVLKGQEVRRAIELYDIWSSYRPQLKGVFIAYASLHGNTAQAAHRLADMLKEGGQKVEIADLARCDMSSALEKAFSYGNIVLAASSYNGGVMPAMEDFLHHLKGKGLQNRRVALIENGSWAPSSARTMGDILSQMKNITLVQPTVTIRGAVKDDDIPQLKALCQDILD